MPQIPPREPSMKRLRKKYIVPFKGCPYRLITIRTRSHRPRMRTFPVLLVKRRSGHKSSLDESDAPLDDVDREASPHRGVVSSSLASRTRTANGVIMDRIPFALALLASLNRIYARVFRACTHSSVIMRIARRSPVQRTT